MSKVKLKKIIFILMISILMLLLKSGTCQATAQDVLGQKENAVGTTVYTGGSELYNRWGNFENVYCARQDKTLNDGQNYNCDVVYYIEIKGNEAKFCNRTNKELREVTGSGTDYRWGQLGNILALGKNKGYRNSSGCTDTQYALWYFLGTENKWVTDNFGSSWAIQSSYFTHARWHTTLKQGKSLSDKCANLAKTNSGYKGTVRIYWLEAKNQYKNQSLMIVELEKSEGPEMILIDKQDSKDKSYLGGVSFKIKNNVSGKYIKKANSVEDKTTDRLVYEVAESSTDNTEYWTSNIAEAMTFTTGTKQDYRGLQIKGIPAGEYTAIETSNPYGGYDSNINKEFKLSTTTVDDYDNSNIIYNERETQKGNVMISGMVWEDLFTGKSTNANGRKDSSENGIDGVKVYWKAQDGSIIASEETKNGGKYTMYANINLSFCAWQIDQDMYNRINNSYVEFEYNGLTYTTVPYVSDGAEDTSKAMESTSGRTSLDNSFAEISNKGVSSNGTRLEYTYTGSNPRKATLSAPVGMDSFTVTADTKTPLSKFKMLESYPALDTSEKSGCIRHHYVSCSKHGSHHRCDEYGSKIVEWEISNVNCGLIKREQPDISIVSDIEKVDVLMKGQQYTYTYGDRGIQGQDYKYQVSFSDSNSTLYRRPVNPSDVAYINANNTEDLEVYVTYAMKVNNQSNTLIMEVPEIVNYYDANYTLADSNWSEKSQNGDSYNSNGFKAAYTSQLKGKKVEPQGTSDVIKLRLKVNSDVVKDLIKKDTLFKNVAEIYKYSTYYGSETQCAEFETASKKGMSGRQSAGVDVDSAPGNAEIKVSNNSIDFSTFEDDTDIAPTFMLVKDDKYKQISGIVFEDEQTSESAKNNERLGDGQRFYTEEKKDKDKNEKGIKNVKVELLKVNDDGTTELAYLYSIKSGQAEKSPAVTYTDENGHYQFGSDSDEGCVVDNYIVKYTYGDDTTELANGATTVDNGETVINARNYKSTVITDNTIKNVMTKNYDNKQDSIDQKDLQWHLTKADNTSIAVDDLDNLQWYFKKGDNSLVKVNVNSDETANGYDKDARLQIQSLINKNYNDPVNVSAYSLPFKVQIEYTGSQESKVDNNGGNFEHNWSKFNFGIIERARENIIVDKTVSNLKITLANGQILTEGDPYAINMDYVRALGSKEVVNSREAFSKAVKSQRQLFMEMDSELIQGSTLEILYKITVTNASEKDYEYDSKDNGNEKYYYYGESASDLIKQSVEYIADYVDPELICEAGEGTQNANWVQIKAEKLYNEGNISELVLKGDEDKYRVKGLEKDNYTVLVTNAFNNLSAGESHSETLYASKLLATQAKDHVYENHTEIIQLNGKIARTIDSTNKGTQVAKKYIPGDYMPSLKVRAEQETELTRLHEQDDDAITVTITPPTGLENNTIIYISAGVVALIILAGGVFLIKRKAVNK